MTESLYFRMKNGAVLTGKATTQGDKILLDIPFIMKDEIKIGCSGARWIAPHWMVNNNERSRLILKYLQGYDVYQDYDKPLVPYEGPKDLYQSQVEIIRHILTRKCCIVAAEMGMGKSRAFLEAFVYLNKTQGLSRAWFIAPKSALESVKFEWNKWKPSITPIFMTYEEMVRVLKGWDSNMTIPQIICFDEASRLKNDAAQRSQAAMHLAEHVRQAGGYVVLMSGSPAPKSPADWFSLCLAKGTWILTESGPQQIEDINGPQNVVNDSRLVWSNTGSFVKGIKSVYRIETDEGHSVEATENHKFMILKNGVYYWEELKNLKKDDKLNLQIHYDLIWKGIGGVFNEGYILGNIIGDGSIQRNPQLRSGFVTILSLFKSNLYMKDKIESMIQSKACVNKDGSVIKYEGRWLDKLRAKWELDETKEITKKMQMASSDFIRGLISGLFDTDGSIENNRLRISLTQISKSRIQIIQRLLGYFGIYSKYLLARKAGQYPGITNKNKLINCQACYVLIVSGKNAIRFNEVIGFLDTGRKIDKNIKSQMSLGPTTKVKEIKYVGEREVYDISVPETNRFSANNFTTHNCEIAFPGFLREGHVNKFKDRIAIIRYEENQGGIKYPKLITYRDDVRKCNICGKFQEHLIHEKDDFADLTYLAPGTAADQVPHEFVAMVNEVEALHKRLNGLVVVQFKKDFLDLPEKIYQEINLKPSSQTLRLAKLIKKAAPSAAQALIDLRTLSDGFQYTEKLVGTIKCTHCDGTKKILIDGADHDCIHCSKRGVINQYERYTAECETPKIEALENYLDLKEEDGRLVVFAGFTASIDRICKTVTKNKWDFIKVDGRGWHSTLGSLDPQELLKLFADRDNGKKICFIGHPGSAGMGLTLTASDTIIYYSNDFNAESRIQSESRIHRIGSRGANIIDFVHLPVDALVIENLKKKQDLMSITMGQLDKCMEELVA